MWLIATLLERADLAEGHLNRRNRLCTGPKNGHPENPVWDVCLKAMFSL